MIAIIFRDHIWLQSKLPWGPYMIAILVTIGTKYDCNHQFKADHINDLWLQPFQIGTNYCCNRNFAILELMIITWQIKKIKVLAAKFCNDCNFQSMISSRKKFCQFITFQEFTLVIPLENASFWLAVYLFHRKFGFFVFSISNPFFDNLYFDREMSDLSGVWK